MQFWFIQIYIYFENICSNEEITTSTNTTVKPYVYMIYVIVYNICKSCRPYGVHICMYVYNVFIVYTYIYVNNIYTYTYDTYTGFTNRITPNF